MSFAVEGFKQAGEALQLLRRLALPARSAEMRCAIKGCDVELYSATDLMYHIGCNCKESIPHADSSVAAHWARSTPAAFLVTRHALPILTRTVAHLKNNDGPYDILDPKALPLANANSTWDDKSREWNNEKTYDKKKTHLFSLVKSKVAYLSKNKRPREVHAPFLLLFPFLKNPLDWPAEALQKVQETRD